jgi:hypothetical protein
VLHVACCVHESVEMCMMLGCMGHVCCCVRCAMYEPIRNKSPFCTSPFSTPNFQPRQAAERGDRCEGWETRSLKKPSPKIMDFGVPSSSLKFHSAFSDPVVHRVPDAVTVGRALVGSL